MRNVSRTWTYETGLLVGQEPETEIPYNDYYEYFGPDYRLDVRPNNMENMNTREYLDKILIQVRENLRHTQFAPNVQMQDVPRDADYDSNDEEDAHDPNVRQSSKHFRTISRRLTRRRRYLQWQEGPTRR